MSSTASMRSITMVPPMSTAMTSKCSRPRISKSRWRWWPCQNWISSLLRSTRLKNKNRSTSATMTCTPLCSNSMATSSKTFFLKSRRSRTLFCGLSSSSKTFRRALLRFPRSSKISRLWLRLASLKWPAVSPNFQKIEPKFWRCYGIGSSSKSKA